ncbi:hypothetical protein [Halococcus salsus]|uniref:hypothetical protein n=1 Tax=Halococcus salsus TaxID=2162894 RepID=UPI001F047B87|nr:hypothetical protein [Halococcus salsus]
MGCVRVLGVQNDDVIVVESCLANLLEDESESIRRDREFDDLRVGRILVTGCNDEIDVVVVENLEDFLKVFFVGQQADETHDDTAGSTGKTVRSARAVYSVLSRRTLTRDEMQEIGFTI